MGDLSRNFSTSEFSCHCCGGTKLDMTLIKALERLRETANSPIKINCAYRCEKHNQEVGGASNSYHLKGQAADIVIRGKTVRGMYVLANQIAEFRYGGIGIYPDRGFIHVDTRGYSARWGYLGGKTVSFAKAFTALGPDLDLK